MKSILCYGDSLTFGAHPVTGQPRHAFEDRWPTTLEAGLGGAVRVIAEGLGGRTTVFDDWNGHGDRNGARILPTLLASHSPLDMIIIMLGTNDLKPHTGLTAAEAARGVVRLVELTRGHYAQRNEPLPEMLMMAPPSLVPGDNADMMGHFGGDRAIEESRKFSALYQRRAGELGVHFFDAGTVAKADPADGVHLDASNTRAIGEALVPLVRKILRIGG